jgi:hypothetical protein
MENGDNRDKNKEKILIGVAIVLVIAIAVVGVFAFMSLNNDNQDTGFGSFSSDNGPNNSNSGTISTSSIPLSEVHGLAASLSSELNTKDIGEISSVEYKGVTFTKEQCLYIFAKAVEMKNSGLNGNINFKSFASPNDPLNRISTKYLVKSEYVDMAQRTCNWMDSHGRAPNYTGIVVPGSPDFGYDGLVLAFCIVILQSENGSLPPAISW